MIHILFEQSGTFKKAFKQLGYDAVTYDIENRFNQTDYELDLFEEIEEAYHLQPSIFDNIQKEDLVIAFFPCTYFSGQNALIYSRKFKAFKQWDNKKIDDYIEIRRIKRDKFLRKLTQLVEIARRKGFRLIVENPYSGSYLLTQEEYKNPQIIIKDRTLYGDDMRKPTMFYFYNMTPKNNAITMERKEVARLHNNIGGITRSLIHIDFALNFIKQHLL